MSIKLLAAAMLAQVALGFTAPVMQDRLPRAQPNLVRALAFGEEAAAARIAMLALQSEDRRLPLKDLDYGALDRWLEACMQLDPRGSYPMQAATLVYAAVPDPERSRRMLAFVARHYAADPVRHRHWMEVAVVMARHHLGDTAYAAQLQQELDAKQEGAVKPALPLD